MNKTLKRIGALATALLMCWPLLSAQPKQEFRASWVSTVYALDWPTIGASAETQKAELDKMFDSLAVNNFNAVLFQVRPMADAFYKSSYEPWSSYLTGTRGKDPGYDPLEYAVEAAHKRGMELHAWVNPYRFSTNGLNQWNTEQDNALKNDGRLLSHTTSSGTVSVILDPGQRANRIRIANICKEIVKNYDVDGLSFDDYFYVSGTPLTSDAGDYTEWQQSGTSLTFAQWRRNNVRLMVQAVYDTIQATKPWVRFGISPAGVTGRIQEQLDDYNITACPTGSDWQYNGIFCDPIAWYNDKSVDYISPQLYWTFAHATNGYAALSNWWSQIANQFGRHMFVSHSISTLTSTSNSPVARASGTGGNTYVEYANEVNQNRDVNLQDAPGSIWFRTKFLYVDGASQSFGNYLHSNVYQYPALPPAMTWKGKMNVTEQVSNVSYESSSYTLSWDAIDNVRYTVYSIPDSVKTSDFNCQVKYLGGITYANTFKFPRSRRTGYYFAVCVLDRNGFEHEPLIFGASTAVDDVNATKTVASVKYYNAAGILSAEPQQGVNIVVTSYTDGTTSTTKIVK